jgi:hypothetical protein
MPIKLTTAGIVLAVCLTPTRSFAQTGSIPEEVVEPILTEETLPEEQGECDLRSSVAYRAASLEPANALPRLQLFCGLSPRWGAEMSVPFAYPDQQVHNVGFGDVATTFKYRLNSPSGKTPFVVLGVETRFPTGTPSRGSGEEGFEVEPFVALLAQRSHLGLQGNFGIGFPAGSKEQTFRSYYYNAAASVRLASKRLHFIGEANGSHSGTDSMFSLSPGLHYQITEALYVAAAFPAPVRGGTGRVGIVIQMQVRLLDRRRPE